MPRTVRKQYAMLLNKSVEAYDRGGDEALGEVC